jgi:hypothetical protein
MTGPRRQDDAGGSEQEEAMALEGIGRGNVVSIELLRRLHAAQDLEKAANPRTPPTEAAGTEPSAGLGVRSAEERTRLLDTFKSETAGLPDVRRDKVIEAKVRISTGYYNRDEIRREVLRSVLANLLPSRPASEATATPPGDEGAHGSPEEKP